MADALGTILTAARYRKGWSLRDAERETGVPNAHISQIETGGIRRPSITTLIPLAKGYGLAMRDLLEAAGHGSDWAWAMDEDAIRADERRKYEDLLGSIYLYVSWCFVTRQLTTTQKELFADAVDADTARINAEEPGIDLQPAERWWRDDA